MKIEENYSLLAHNTFGLDVKTRWFVEYESEEDLLKILSDEYFLSLPFLHIGEGSNLLFLQDYEGVILHSGIKGIETLKEDDDEIWIKAGAGVSWDYLVDYCVSHGWGGIENLSNIPGEVGASAIQNIGAYGVESKDSIVEVHAYNIETRGKEIFTNADCRFDYRHSIFKKEYKGRYFITHVVFCLHKRPVFHVQYGNLQGFLQNREINLQSVRDAVIAIRESKLPNPKEIGNAGSYFMNPIVGKDKYEVLKVEYADIPHFVVSEEKVKIPAAWLIEQCGLKGQVFGNVAVYEKQPLVIINKGNATGDEIASLAEKIRKMVADKFGVELQPEVNYI